MLGMPFADEMSSRVATKKRAAVDSDDGVDDDAPAGDSPEAAYSFEGYQIESSERIMLTPMGVPAAAPRPRR